MLPLSDLSTLIALLLGICLLIWTADVLLLRPARLRAAAGAPVKDPVLIEYARSFLPVVALVLVIRAFVFEPFRIPSESMMPGLTDGDFIFVSKYRYSLRLPVFNTEIARTGQPQRGDVERLLEGGFANDPHFEIRDAGLELLILGA